MRVKDVMTTAPMTFPASATLIDAARSMKELNIGDVLVARDEHVIGILTDRDMVVRGIVHTRDPAEVRLGDICSTALTTLAPNDTVAVAERLMRESGLRRLPICEDGVAVGILTLGDLARLHDADSALAQIAAAPPNT